MSIFLESMRIYHLMVSAAAVAAVFACTDTVSAADGRSAGHDDYNSTRSAVERLMRRAVPRLQYDPAMPADSLAPWREEMSAAMRRLMNHPAAPAALPRRICEARRDGYTVERWESFPLDEHPVAFFVMRPDSAHASHAAVLCIPGSGQTKELLAGEREGNFSLDGAPDSIVPSECLMTSPRRVFCLRWDGAISVWLHGTTRLCSTG